MPPADTPQDSESARAALIHLLQRAHAGERAAWHAYYGHAKSVWNKAEREEITAIKDSEWEHRDGVHAMLRSLEAAPSAWRNALMLAIGTVIHLLCRLGAWSGPIGWYASMDGAGRLEAQNVHEYVDAAVLARQAGRDDLVPELMHMAEVEWEHERFFYEHCAGHWLHRFAPKWPRPGPRPTLPAPV